MTSWDGGTLDEREYLIVRGTVQQIVYYNDENGYAVLRLAAENGAEVTATGTFPNIGLGEEVILTGCWVTHPTYGEQFATEAFERRLPTSVRGIAGGTPLEIEVADGRLRATADEEQPSGEGASPEAAPRA